MAVEMTPPGQQAMPAPAAGVGLVEGHGEDTPAYQVLKRHNKLNTEYRVMEVEELDTVEANSTPWQNLVYQIACCPCVVGGIIKTFEVKAGTVRKCTDGRGGFFFYGKGVHLITDMFYQVQDAVPIQEGHVQHGDRGIAIVEQGQIGYLQDKGHPVLLPPGLHQWQSPTLEFQKCYNLNNNVISLGPMTLLTVDSGYAAVTEDNGQQEILMGGSTYLLTHQNHKFVKYITQKIQSDNMKRIEATSADNVLMAVDATVIWRITDVEEAARKSAETIAKDGGRSNKGDLTAINKIRGDTLKQAEASLAAFIGAVNYSDKFNVAAAIQKRKSSGGSEGELGASPASGIHRTKTDPRLAAGGATSAGSSPLFDADRMATTLDHANAVTGTYGVTILSINVVAAVPADKSLAKSLAAGAIATADAQKLETVAAGKAQAAKIKAAGEAEAEILKARGESKAEQVRAEGKRKAADLLQQNEVAVQLAMIEKAADALGDNKAFFFGNDGKDVTKMLIHGIGAPPKAIGGGL